MSFKEIIKADLYRYTKQTNISEFFKMLMVAPGFRYTFFLRLYASKNPLVRVIARFFLILTSIMYGYQIGLHTRIGKGLYIGHYGALVVNGAATIGENCNLAQGVVIGQANRGKMQGVPTIGNRVWIGANVIIVGKVTIADNVLIAPGAYVNFDVPSNSMVIGNPGVIKTYSPEKDVVEGYVHNPV